MHRVIDARNSSFRVPPTQALPSPWIRNTCPELALRRCPRIILCVCNDAKVLDGNRDRNRCGSNIHGFRRVRRPQRSNGRLQAAPRSGQSGRSGASDDRQTACDDGTLCHRLEIDRTASAWNHGGHQCADSTQGCTGSADYNEGFSRRIGSGRQQRPKHFNMQVDYRPCPAFVGLKLPSVLQPTATFVYRSKSRRAAACHQKTGDCRFAA
jgi:hypothetical protein